LARNVCKLILSLCKLLGETPDITDERGTKWNTAAISHEYGEVPYLQILAKSLDKTAVVLVGIESDWR
jgi:hypothetical protein